MSSASSPLSTQQRLQQLTPQQKVALQQHLQAQKAKTAANGSASPQQPDTPNAGSNGQPQQQQSAMQQQLRQVRGKLGSYNFASTTQEILRKYSKYPPSLSFHIYDTHFRFNNTLDSSVIPKDSPMVKSFLQHMLSEEIPSAMTELLKDFSIKFYDGCLILQVYDHRNMISKDKASSTPQQQQQQQQQQQKPGQKQEESSASSKAASPQPEQKKPDPAQKPKTYRTLLRPTPLSLYYDLLYHTDSALTRFTDPLSLQMESEILTLTNRKLHLSVPLNPYLQSKKFFPEHEYPKKVWDEKAQDWKMVHSHREETPTELRKLHQDQLVMHKSTEYEDLMLLLSNKQKPPSESASEKQLVVVGPSNNSSSSSDPVSLEGTPTVGASSTGDSGGSKKRSDASTSLNASSSVLSTGNPASNQFMRLRYIEEIRKRKEAQKAQAGAAMASQAVAAPGNAATGGMVKNGTLGAAAAANFQRQQQLKQQALAKLMTAQIQQQQAQQVQQQRLLQQQAQQLQQSQKQQSPVPSQMQLAQHQQQQQHQQHQAQPQPQQQFPTHPVQQQQQSQYGQAQATPQSQSPPQVQPPNAAALNRALLPQANQGYQSPQMQQGIRRATYMGQMNQNMNPASRVADMNSGMSPRMNPAVNAQMTPQMNQAMSPQLNQARSRPSPSQTPQMNDQATMRAQQLQLQQARQLQLQRQQSLQAQQEQLRTAKRQRTSIMGQQIPPQQSPQFQGRTPQMGNASPPSNVGTPVMQNGTVPTPNMGAQMPQLAQSLQQTQQPTQLNQRPATQPATGTGASSSGQPQNTLQHQQQQIFQMTLSPQEQQEFRQIQAKMNQLVQMGNTGIAPNKARLSPQHQQQAIQHAKMLQQQLLQRFPNYFQKLRQLQQIQQQRRQAFQRQQQQLQQQRQQQQSQQLQQSAGMKLAQGQGLGNMDAVFNQQNMGMNMNLAAAQQQMMSLPMMGQMNLPNLQQQPKR